MPRVKVAGKGEVEEVTKGKVYKVRRHLGRDPQTGKHIRSPKRTVHGIFSQMMKSAVRDRLVPSNPCDAVDAPRPKPKKRRPFELEDALRLAKAIRESEVTGKTVAVWMALATGMRRGEMLGLSAPADGFAEACRTAYGELGPIRSARETFGCWMFEAAGPGLDPLAVPLGGGEPFAVPVAGLTDGDAGARALAESLGTDAKAMLRAVMGRGAKNLLVPSEFER